MNYDMMNGFVVGIITAMIFTGCIIASLKAGIEVGREDAMQKMGVKVEATK